MIDDEVGQEGIIQEKNASLNTVFCSEYIKRLNRRILIEGQEFTEETFEQIKRDKNSSKRKASKLVSH